MIGEFFGALLEYVQNADNAVKRRWLVASSAVAGVFVFFLWIVNFNVMMAQNASPTADSGASVSSPSLLGKISADFGVVGSGISRELHALGNIIGTPKEDVVRPNQ